MRGNMTPLQAPLRLCTTCSEADLYRPALLCRGAFKYRGASNAIRHLSAEERKRGVVTHSSGNHAAALALAAAKQGVTAHIVCPDSTPKASLACCPPLIPTFAALMCVLAWREACHRLAVPG